MAQECDMTPQLIRDSDVIEIIDDFEDYKYGDGNYQVNIKAIEGGEEIDLHYLKGFLTQDEVARLIELCDSRSGWTSSPQRDQEGKYTRYMS